MEVQQALEAALKKIEIGGDKKLEDRIRNWTAIKIIWLMVRINIYIFSTFLDFIRINH